MSPRPCPFCGYRTHVRRDVYAHVQCAACGASGPRHRDAEIARAAWDKACDAIAFAATVRADDPPR